MLWVERLTLSNFRNYSQAALEAGPEPQVLIGANGAGKTNLLEAVSLLAPGQGMRRAAYPDLARGAGDGGWAVAAHTHTHMGPVDIGTGLLAENADNERAGRIVRIDGETAGAGALADYIELVWLTPAMDGLFTGPGSERRRFLDRLILCFDPHYRTGASRFERAMQQRNRLLADGVRDPSRFEGLELLMAETGVAIAAQRAEAVAALASIMAERTARDPNSPFPAAGLALEGALEADLERLPAVELEDLYRQRLRDGRERDRAAGRTLDGPHRSDLLVAHAPKSMPARLCSTASRRRCSSASCSRMPSSWRVAAKRLRSFLLDEITAHLDAARRAALFEEILRLGAQAWMTGTDAAAFSFLDGKARFWRVDDGLLSSFEGVIGQGAAAPSN
ncbi:MAG: DNA replication/repair protein RecF [Hyphomicrobium sp.]